jgi:hypothetical protein
MCGGRLRKMLQGGSEYSARETLQYESTDGKSWSSEVNYWEKPAQSARLVSHFGELDTVGNSVDMRNFT